MSKVISKIRNEYDGVCLVSKKLNKKKCRLSLKGIPTPNCIIDFDKKGAPLGRGEARCDLLVIVCAGDNRDIVAPLELKSGALDASKARSQLQAGANAAEEIIPKDARTVFRPVFACARVPRIQRKELKLKKNKVRFFKQRATIALIKCGEKFNKALGE